MSHNDSQPERQAKNHTPAIIAIALAVLAVVILFFVFTPGDPTEGGDGIATTEAPAGTVTTEAEGTGATEAEGSGN